MSFIHFFIHLFEINKVSRSYFDSYDHFLSLFAIRCLFYICPSSKLTYYNNEQTFSSGARVATVTDLTNR